LLAQFKNPISHIDCGQVPDMIVSIVNNGPTAAYQFFYETWAEVFIDEFSDFTSKSEHTKSTNPATIYANEPEASWISVKFPHLSTGEETSVASRKGSLCVRIKIDYKDAFGQPRWQNFGYELKLGSVSNLPKYNDSN
jgi:hypothetical protein